MGRAGGGVWVWDGDLSFGLWEALLHEGMGLRVREVLGSMH